MVEASTSAFTSISLTTTDLLPMLSQISNLTRCTPSATAISAIVILPFESAASTSTPSI